MTAVMTVATLIMTGKITTAVIRIMTVGIPIMTAATQTMEAEILETMKAAGIPEALRSHPVKRWNRRRK